MPTGTGQHEAGDGVLFSPQREQVGHPRLDTSYLAQKSSPVCLGNSFQVV